MNLCEIKSHWNNLTKPGSTQHTSWEPLHYNLTKIVSVVFTCMKLKVIAMFNIITAVFLDVTVYRPVDM